MAVEVKLPRLGQGMEAGTIVRWLKAEGDAVAKGEPLYELDTDKVTQEVEADADGVLLKIVIADGEVDVGTTVGVIGAEGEDVSEPRRRERRLAPAGGRGGPAAEASASAAHGGRELPARGGRGTGTLRRRGSGTRRPPRRALAGAGERVKASPLARRIARERGVDLASIAGTGPEGG